MVGEHSQPAPWETWRTEMGASAMDEGESAGRGREREGGRIGEAQGEAAGAAGNEAGGDERGRAAEG